MRKTAKAKAKAIPWTRMTRTTTCPMESPLLRRQPDLSLISVGPSLPFPQVQKRVIMLLGAQTSAPEPGVRSRSGRAPMPPRQGILREAVLRRTPGVNPRALDFMLLTRDSNKLRRTAVLILAILPREAPIRRVGVAVVGHRPLVVECVHRPETSTPTIVHKQIRIVLARQSASLAAAVNAARSSHTSSSILSDHERRTAWGWLASF
jgi:hypothetical protein